MNTQIKLSNEGNKVSVAFEPELDNSTFVQHINLYLNAVPSVLLNILSTIPLLRPASDVEQEHKIYVFAEDEKGEEENRLYKYRKDLYDTISAIFSELLTTAFPDIQYIEQCKVYQQDFCATHNEEETAEHLSEISKISDYVREHMSEIIAQVFEGEDTNE